MVIAIHQKKNLLLLGGLLLIVMLSYFGLRFMPAHQQLVHLSAQLQADKTELANPRYPEVPDEDADALEEQEEKLKAEILAMETAMKANLDALQGTSDQDVILKVSEIARASNVKITENVPFVVQKAQADAQKGKQAQPANAQGRTKAERKKLRREKRAAGANNTMQSGIGEPEGTLIYQLVNDFPEPRPMQAMTLEGAFYDLKSFMRTLGSMPFQVTVARIDIATKTDVQVQGMPQLLQVKIILAM